MPALLAIVFLAAAALPAWAQSPLVAELRLWSVRYHEEPQRIDELKAALEKAAQGDAGVDTLPALSQVCFIYGDVRAKNPEEKLEAYDRGREAMEAALEFDSHYSNMRVGLARTLSKKGRTADARREALAVLDEKAPSKPADWTVKDVPQAKALLARIKDRS